MGKLIFNSKINMKDITVSSPEEIEKCIEGYAEKGHNYFELGQTEKTLQIFAFKIEKDGEKYITKTSTEMLDDMRHKDYRRIGWLAYVEGTIGEEVAKKINEDETYDWYKIPIG